MDIEHKRFKHPQNPHSIIPASFFGISWWRTFETFSSSSSQDLRASRGSQWIIPEIVLQDTPIFIVFCILVMLVWNDTKIQNPLTFFHSSSNFCRSLFSFSSLRRGHKESFGAFTRLLRSRSWPSLGSEKEGISQYIIPLSEVKPQGSKKSSRMWEYVILMTYTTNHIHLCIYITQSKAPFPLFPEGGRKRLEVGHTQGLLGH